jgi:NADH-quinone oxidoreductase subunit G
MSEEISLIIDGQTVNVPPGTFIIEAAKKIGIEIPTFCYDERLRSVGACRMCLVEVEKMPKLVASCATPVAPGMIVHTDSERVVKARKGVLEFLLINHPLDCPTCDKGGECPLQDNTYLYGPPISRYRENKIRFMEEDVNQRFDDIPLGPEIMLCRNRCIMCYKCVRIVRDLAGEADLGVFRRGASANINVLKEVAFADEFSGNTVEYCPVGALTSRSFRYKIRDWLLKKAPSVCNLCSDGCSMNIEWSRGEVFRHMARRNPDVDDGWLCDRGRYSFDISRSKERITRPHIRRGNTLEPCGWDEALALVARHLGRIIEENRGSEVAAVGSPTLSNEEAYAIGNFFGDTVKSASIDFQTDTDQPVDLELLEIIRLDGTIKDLENDSVFLFVGCDPAVEHPVMSLRIRKAISRNKAKAISIGSYEKRLGYFPVANIRIPAAAEAFALNYLSTILSGTTDLPLPEVRMDTGSILKLGRELKDSPGVHIIAGRGFFSHPDRRAFLSSLIKLKKSTAAKLSILPPQGNYIGVSRFGLYGGPDRSFNDILSHIDSEAIKTAFIFGANPLDEYPDRKYIHDVLKKLDFLVVATPFLTPTASLASVVFPQALLADYGGTFVNIEGRIQRFEPMTENRRFDFRPVWSLLGGISGLLEMGTVWYHDSQVRQEMAANMKGMEELANIPDGGLLVSFGAKNDYDPGEIQPRIPPRPSAENPYLLQWTPSVHHSGWLTEESENLMRIAGNQEVWMHPDDAAREGISENQVVRIGTEKTALNLHVKVTDRVNQGEILIINSFAENPVNRLIRKDQSITYVSVRKN